MHWAFKIIFAIIFANSRGGFFFKIKQAGFVFDVLWYAFGAYFKGNLPQSWTVQQVQGELACCSNWTCQVQVLVPWVFEPWMQNAPTVALYEQVFGFLLHLNCIGKKYHQNCLGLCKLKSEQT